MGHVKAFEKTSCKYPIRRVEVKVDTVPRGNMNYVQDNMFLGQLPKRLVNGCVDSDATFGHEQWYILHYYYSKKKVGMHFRACAEHTSGNDVTSGHVTSCYFIPVRTASGDVTSSNTCVMARSPLLP
jgi:hypothetical protein